MMETENTASIVDEIWDGSIVPVMKEYLTVPCMSPAYDPEWEHNGLLERVVDLAAEWVRSRHLAGTTVEVVRSEGRTPLLYIEVAGSSPQTVLLYGHLDKQPPTPPWAEGLHPYRPVIRDDFLYGRGAADDGYAVFAEIAAIEALQRQGIPHPRCVLVIEACEESGSPDLPHYMDLLAERIGTPQLIICQDAGCGDYERLWVVDSLRGLVDGILTVNVLRQGMHSGDASGVVASSFRIARSLLERLEDSATGRIRPPEFHVEVPPERLELVRQAAVALASEAVERFPFVDGMRPVEEDPLELLLNRTWRPQLAVTGAGGLPAAETAGNVLRPFTSLRLSLRIPPTLDPERARGALKDLLEEAPPYGAAVEFRRGAQASGWSCPPLARWLDEALSSASREFFGNDPCFVGEGGSIPFMSMLAARYPGAQFVVGGVLGPGSNAHGPNEGLHLPTARRVSACLARVLAAQAAAE